jgi:nitric oxide reductase activation protein
LKIPFSVIGFDAESGGNDVYHRHFVDFDRKSPKERRKLMNITARAQNRDGMSIKYAGEFLKTRPEEDKILIVISDGQPAHPSGRDVYGGSYGINDSARAVKDLEKDGVLVYGVAIGDGRNALREIYTKNYIDIPVLKQLPVRLVKLVEKHLLK